MNLILTGLRGTGKSSIGRRLAIVLRRPFYDTDLLIEQQIGEPIGIALPAAALHLYRATPAAGSQQA